MLFNSLSFLFLFFPLTYFGFWQLRTKQKRYRWLTLTGYVFYSFWDVRFCALMAFSTVVSYLAGRGMLRWDDRPAMRRLCLIGAIAVDLSLLGFFKYAGFALDNAAGLARLVGYDVTPPALHIILPVGISFYTFHTLTYVIDSYRRTITPTRNFLELSCYVSMFSQLVAGPIVRFRQVEGDLARLGSVDRHAFLDRGWSFFAIGLIEKVLIADTIAGLIDPPLADYAQLSTVGAWLCMLGYTYQLYFDFAGYSHMAVGLGLLFGIRLPQNFNSPYKALDIADFWRRWHISLSSCLRDYLYIPLGGNRGPRWTTYCNLMVTMLIGGLWHGASWTFVVWGGYHGLLLMAYRAWGHRWDTLPGSFRRGGTFLLVVVGWVFFRSTDFDMALTILRLMFTPDLGALVPAAPSLVFALVVAALLAHRAPNPFEWTHRWSPRSAVALCVLFGLCVFTIYGGPPSPFLYFQF
jgi:alginate O-acetyltransferase complex protein AlgI